MANLFIGADHTVTYSGATAGGSYLNSGTCTFAVTDVDGTALTAATGTLSYVAASNGNYSGTIESTVTAQMARLQVYYVEITFSQAAYNDFRRLECVADYRGED